MLQYHDLKDFMMTKPLKKTERLKRQEPIDFDKLDEFYGDNELPAGICFYFSPNLRFTIHGADQSTRNYMEQIAKELLKKMHEIIGQDCTPQAMRCLRMIGGSR